MGPFGPLSFLDPFLPCGPLCSNGFADGEPNAVPGTKITINSLEQGSVLKNHEPEGPLIVCFSSRLHCDPFDMKR